MNFFQKSILTVRRGAILAVLFFLPAPAVFFAQTPAPANQKVFNNRLILEGAIGGSVAAGNPSESAIDPGWTAMVGGGYNLTRRLSILLEGSFDYNPMPGPVLQTARETSGSYQFWTFSANPMFHLFRGQKYGFYAVGGGGYSHVVTSFNKPLNINCNVYSGFGYSDFANVCSGKFSGSSYSSNQPMYDFGLGGDVRLFPTHREILFVETRYVRTSTPAGQLPGPNAALVPIVIGVRW
jgi:hypothetical protein